MKRLVLLIIIIIISGINLKASIIEDLDKAPEGAHEGQMLLGVLFSIGYPIGSSIDAEDSFMENSSYTFSDSGITKLIVVDYLAFNIGLFFEYMPFDYVGIRTKFRRSMIIQRTFFGSEYDNETKLFFSDYALLAGPSFHVTKRKWWDVNIIPLAGYFYGRYEAASVVNQLIPDITDKRIQYIHGLTIGAEITFAAYFEKGFFLSLGFEWSMNFINLNEAYDVTNPQTSIAYTTNKGLSIHTFGFIIAIGYAFDN